MLISSMNNNTLGKENISTNPDILKASDLLYQIINASYMCSKDCLEREINGNRETVSSLYLKCREDIKQVSRGGEKTEFLTMSILEDTFNKVLPLLLIRLEDLANGNDSLVKAAIELRQIFQENPYKKMWAEKADSYIEILSQMGFKINSSDYQDLTAILDPLLDAFTLYCGKRNYGKPSIHKMRKGKISNKRPEFANSICKYRSEREFVDAVAACEKESVIIFGAVEKTNRQVTDGYNDWYYGYHDERMRNTMRNEGISEEEYLNSIAEFTRCVYLCVKSAETIWLMAMPYSKEGYHFYEDSSSKFSYGRRSGYAPYEIFYKEVPAAQKDTSFLAVPRKGYLLSELMDDMQKIWLPVFLQETCEKFFLSEPESDFWILPEEITAVVPVQYSSGRNMKEIVPLITSVQCTAPMKHEIEAPATLFSDEPEMVSLFDFFAIGPEDILDASVLPVNCMTEDEVHASIRRRIRTSYLKALAEKVSGFLDCKWEIRKEIVRFILQNQETIIKQATNGIYDSFMEKVVDGTKELDKDGNPVMKSTGLYSWCEKKPSIIHTNRDDSREYSYGELKEHIRVIAFWAGEKTASKPGVVWKIRPHMAADYAALLGMEKKELPEILRMADMFHYFYKKYSNSLPRDLTNEWISRGLDNDIAGKRSIFLPEMADINICMGKKTMKKLLAGISSSKNKD